RIFTNLLHYLQDDPSLAITKVESFDPIVVDKETTLNDLHLPTKADVTLSDDSIISIPVDWDKGDPVYDKDPPGKYVFTGTLQLREDNENEAIVKPEIVVHAQDKKPKEDPRETGGENESEEDEKIEKDKNGDRNRGRLTKAATQSNNMLLIGSLAILVGLSTY